MSSLCSARISSGALSTRPTSESSFSVEWERDRINDQRGRSSRPTGTPRTRMEPARLTDNAHWTVTTIKCNWIGPGRAVGARVCGWRMARSARCRRVVTGVRGSWRVGSWRVRVGVRVAGAIRAGAGRERGVEGGGGRPDRTVGGRAGAYRGTAGAAGYVIEELQQAAEFGRVGQAGTSVAAGQVRARPGPAEGAGRVHVGVGRGPRPADSARAGPVRWVRRWPGRCAGGRGGAPAGVRPAGGALGGDRAPDGHPPVRLWDGDQRAGSGRGERAGGVRAADRRGRGVPVPWAVPVQSP